MERRGKRAHEPSGREVVERRLVALGKKYLRSGPEFVRFTGDEQLDRHLNDIERYPHLFVLGCVADYQVKAEKAWAVPLALAARAGGMGFRTMNRLTGRQIRSVMRGPPALHRFPMAVADRMRKALDLIGQKYRGDASAIWAGQPPGALVVLRFMEFHGIGQKVANMAPNILARQLGVRFSDRYSIDISVDVHVRRVMSRLHLVPPKASIEQVIYAARAANPAYPGLLDRPCFMIGRTWCKPRRPRCSECPMGDCCPSATQAS
jgi:endonuclease-3